MKNHLPTTERIIRSFLVILYFFLNKTVFHIFTILVSIPLENTTVTKFEPKVETNEAFETIWSVMGQFINRQ